MADYLAEIVIVAIVGAGVVTGLLFAFSNFVMRALSDLPAEYGMQAMQRINETILNPVFFIFFFGTPALCAMIVYLSIGKIDIAGYGLLFFGSIAYLLGPFGVTLIFNVPLNNKLAVTPKANAEEEWPVYRRKWQTWNHIRSYIGILSVLLMVWGLSSI